MAAEKAPTLQSPKAVLFDWDNTLVDSWGTIHAALWQTFTTMDVEPWSLEETRRRVRYSMRESFPALFGDAWEEAARTFYDAFERLHLERLAPQQGAGELLAAWVAGSELPDEARYLSLARYEDPAVAGALASEAPSGEL